MPFGICFLLSTQALVCAAPASGRRRSSFLTVSLVVRSLGVLAALFFRGVFYPPCVFVCGIKKSSYKSFKTIRSLCVILTVSIEIYELLILCAAKGVIFTFRKFFCVILFCTFCLFFALRFFPVFYCVFVGMLIVLLAKRRVKLPAVCRFALSFVLPAAAVFCRALLPQRLFCPMFSPFKGTFARTAFFGVTNIYYVIRIYSPVQGCRLTIWEYCGSIQSQWITMLARRKFFTRGAKGEESDYHQTLR